MGKCSRQKPDMKASQAPAVMGHAGGQATMDQLKRLSKGGRPYPLAHYKSLRTHQAKRSFAEKLSIDPEAAFLSTEEKHYCDSHQQCKTAKGLCYLWDVARLNGVKWDPTNEDIVKFCKMLVQGCPQQESNVDSIKAEGWLLYEYSKEMEVEAIEKKGKAVSVSAQAQLNSEEYSGCVDL
eukprot:2814776-Lingulodinium_polyedra.AAC.1